jgi:ABC-type protease/lipase transport system fused ATPase/permease subunit
VIASQSRETLIFLTMIAVGAVLALGLLDSIHSCATKTPPKIKNRR